MVGATVTVLYEPYGMERLEAEVSRLEASLSGSPDTVTGYSIAVVEMVTVPASVLLELFTFSTDFSTFFEFSPVKYTVFFASDEF